MERERIDRLLAAGRAHLERRWRAVLGGGGVALVAVGVVGSLPDRSEAGVASILSHLAAAEVAPEDFVWEASGGGVADASRGRGVVFLARPSAGAPRDVYRARVHVSPGGQPLFASGVERVTRTSLGDEEALTIVGARAFFVSRFRDEVQSIGVIDLPTGDARRVMLARPAREVAFEPTDDAMVLALPDGPGQIAWSGSGEGARGARWTPEGSNVDVPAVTHAATTGGAGSKDEVFPPVDASPVGEGDHPVLFRIARAPGRVFAIDGRQVELHLVDGSAAPGTQTGFMADGFIPADVARRGIVFVIELPAPFGAGSLRRGAWSGPIAKDQAAIALDTSGALLMGAWPYQEWQAPDMVASNALVSTNALEPWALCATRAGHILFAEAVAPDGAEWRSCVAMASGTGPARLIGVEGDGVEWSERVLPRAALVGVRAAYGPSTPPPSGAWATLALGQPTPDWLPAVRTARANVLGIDVSLSWIDSARFDWTLRAGEDERSHRLGGDFPEALATEDAARARIAIGLGVGKRRSPRGMRIDGSTGHRFRGGEGLLVVGPGSLTILGSDRPGSEPREDGTELPMSVDDGELTASARTRGARQARFDLCVHDGAAFLAESTFDSHEANATVLRDLGCKTAVALDWGAERAGWLMTERPGPFSTTALIGLDRPMRGKARAFEPGQ